MNEDNWNNQIVAIEKGEQITKEDVSNAFIEKYFETIIDINHNQTNSFLYINEQLSKHSKQIKEIIKTHSY
ncbi:hypothetical protein JO84_gp256 [Aureococcus anophagefferens virus]|uniref:Uncharacterized protein n=1 Tax=Aureococcus anophagefferens virus TaxID=1474867 RepID=A0A076FM91_9VIRU|nr:hypothetical protein JO84_gp256 [Aureococcus anophagefferens virus]AII17008.1 hypothetical protein AaV_219 [Aureococcus anophagefferens virus]UOG94133.1 hypothetical protein MKD35_92 [Aureococcus anophagefferens virus]